VYVDDILLSGSNLAEIQSLKQHLHSSFGIKDLGCLSYFLGFEVSYLPDGISLTQRKYTQDLLKASGFLNAKPTATPLPLNCKLTPASGVPLPDPTVYRTYIGKLNFLTNTRPDISFAVQTLSQFMQSPTSSHMSALEHLLRYISGTSGQGLLLRGSDSLNLHAYSDSDWASCPVSRRSVTGYVLLLDKSPISWKSKKQSTVARSSAEAEYRAMAHAAAEVTWLVSLLKELGVSHPQPVTLHCDSQSAIHIARNPVFHERTKHIEVDCHFTRDKVMEGLLQLSYLPTQSQIADVLTKILPCNQHWFLLNKLGMLPQHPKLAGGCGRPPDY